jgi:hypothetical protein
LTRTKRKDGPQEDMHTFSIQPVTGTDSVVLSSAETINDLADSAQRVLNMFRATFGRTGASLADLRKVMDMANATFHRAVNTLVKSGMLINEGTNKRPFYQLNVP